MGLYYIVIRAVGGVRNTRLREGVIKSRRLVEHAVRNCWYTKISCLATNKENTLSQNIFFILCTVYFKPEILLSPTARFLTPLF